SLGRHGSLRPRDLLSFSFTSETRFRAITCLQRVSIALNSYEHPLRRRDWYQLRTEAPFSIRFIRFGARREGWADRRKWFGQIHPVEDHCRSGDSRSRTNSDRFRQDSCLLISESG